MKLTKEAYDDAFKTIADAVYKLVSPHLGDSPDVWGNVACQAAENIIDEVCKDNAIEEPDLTE